MNLLAHLFLSDSNKNIIIGNFIADAVKGNKYLNYPKEIQIGILLHREIDNYTDTNSVVKQSKYRLNSRYKHYKGVIIDILYDHFLAKNWHNYSEIPLAVYAENIYNLLEKNNETFPKKVQNLLPYMIQNNWLQSYASIEGISKILEGMNTRTKGVSKMNLAVKDLTENYKELELDFTIFFNDLKQHTSNKTIQLLSI